MEHVILLFHQLSLILLLLWPTRPGLLAALVRAGMVLLPTASCAKGKHIPELTSGPLLQMALQFLLTKAALLG